MTDDISQARRSPVRSGSLADMVDEAAAPTRQATLPTEAIIKAAVVGVLFVLFNMWQFPGLWRAWMDDPNWSHGFVIPLFSVYLLYTRWGDLTAARRRACLWGLPLMLIAMAFVFLGFYPIKTAMVRQWGMVLLLFSLVLYLAGPAVARITWLPIFFLLFAMPIPDMIYRQIATPLQELAAAGSGLLLRLVGVQAVSVSHSNISFLSASGEERNLTVAEACAGMRLLIAFVALGVVMAYITTRPLWQRIILVGATIPIAVLCNVIRVIITCSMFVIDRPELGQDFMHTFTGMMMLGPAFIFLWLLAKLMDSLFVETDEEEEGEGGEPVAQEAGA